MSTYQVTFARSARRELESPFEKDRGGNFERETAEHCGKGLLVTPQPHHTPSQIGLGG